MSHTHDVDPTNKSVNKFHSIPALLKSRSLLADMCNLDTKNRTEIGKIFDKYIYVCQLFLLTMILAIKTIIMKIATLSVLKSIAILINIFSVSFMSIDV